jgi:lipopolysaccharide export system permease protein
VIGLRLFDRYVLREFLLLLCLSLVAFVAIFAIVDLFEKIQDFMDGHATAWTIARYYLFKVPYVVVNVLPVALLMSTFLTLGQMSKFNELTAMATSGVSTGRIIVPLLLVALGCVGVSFALSETVVPEATRRREDILEGEVRKRQVTDPTEYPNVSMLGRDGRVYLVKLYLAPEKRMLDVLVTEMRDNRILRRIDARAARWDGTQWVFEDGVVRVFGGKEGKEAATPFTRLALPELSERPEDFRKTPEKPDEMGFTRLSDYVDRLRRSGLREEKYQVQLDLKLAFPWINFIVVVMGAALAARLRNPNAALGFGISVFTAFFYYGLMRAGEALGTGGTLPPAVAAWMANAIFGLLALVLFVSAQRR